MADSIASEASFSLAVVSPELVDFSRSSRPRCFSVELDVLLYALSSSLES